MQLRYYQTQALDNIEKEFKAGVNRQLLVMATGTGKTPTLSHIPDKVSSQLPGQTLFLVHRDELAKQALDKFRLLNPTKNVQQEAGTLKCDPSITDIIIGSVQTLGRQNSNRIEKFNKETIDKVLVDEAHRSIANSYYNVYNYFNLLENNSNKLLLGCTATPVRGDGEGLGKLYQRIVYTYLLRQAIEDGYLVDVKGIRVDTEISLDNVKTTDGDFNESELAREVDNPYRNTLVAISYLEHCKNRQAIGFGVNIEHAKNLAATFKAKGINAEAVWGNDSDRNDKIQRFRDGKIDVLFNAQLLVEGFDLSTISCIILAAPTKSGVVFSQRVGRGTRLPEGVDCLKNLMIEPEACFKVDCIVLDICDATSRHSLVTLPTLLGLPSGLNLRGRSLVGTCKEVEDIVQKYPHLDFSTLKDADKIQAFVNEVNLFEVHVPKEVEANSEFTWYPTTTGGYRLMLPDKESVRIEQNLLDKWELKAYIKGKRYRGERDTVESAFSAADDLVRKVAPECLKVISQNALWHIDPATDKQLKALKRLYKGKQIPCDLSKGAASKLIGAAKAGKEK